MKKQDMCEILQWLIGRDNRDPRIKKWGMIYALDLPLHGGRSMAQTADAIGCTRAAISTQARDFTKIFNIKPSKWLRKESTVKKNRAARIAFCKGGAKQLL